MSKLKDSLRTVGVFNPYHFYRSAEQEGAVVHIDYYPNGNQRAGQYAHWAVALGTVNLDPEGNTGHRFLIKSKDFSVTFTHSDDPRFSRRGTFAEARQAALREAQDWANKKFGKRPWAKDPWGGYGDAVYVAERLAELKAAAKAKAKAAEEAA
jgi:hypothetical protein